MTHKDAAILISAIKKSGYKPNDWEIDFMQSVNDLQTLSYKQSKCLENIYAKAFDGDIYIKK